MKLFLPLVLAALLGAGSAHADHGRWSTCLTPASYKLEVWEKFVPRTQPPLKSRTYLTFEDCREARQWLLGLFYILEVDVWITCEYIGDD